LNVKWLKFPLNLHLLPIGAYVKPDSKALKALPFQQQAVIYAAGPWMNFLFSAFLLVPLMAREVSYNYGATQALLAALLLALVCWVLWPRFTSLYLALLLGMGHLVLLGAVLLVDANQVEGPVGIVRSVADASRVPGPPVRVKDRERVPGPRDKAKGVGRGSRVPDPPRKAKADGRASGPRSKSGGGGRRAEPRRWVATTVPAPLQDSLIWGIVISLGLGLFNLTPLFPLDGGRIVSAGLHEKWGENWGLGFEAVTFAAIAGLLVFVLMQDFASLLTPK
jgi:membrane-associated protease RseP (regulator of RpoE activity)